MLTMKEYIPRLSNIGVLDVMDDPYWCVNIDAKDHSSIQYADFRNWARSHPCTTGTLNGYNYVKLPVTSSYSSVDLTGNITIPKTGMYKIEIITLRLPKGGNFKLFDGSTQIEETKSCTHKWQHWRRWMYHKMVFSGGEHTFKITVDKNIPVVGMYIYRVNEYRGSNKSLRGIKSINRLDIDAFDFTLNNVNETNSINVNAALRDDFYVDYDSTYPMSKLKIDFMDPITIELGKEPNEAGVMFGGYVLSPEPNNDTLNIKGGDRFLDLMRIPAYMNFKIGNPNITQQMNTFPYQSFSTIEDALIYFCETNEWCINTYKINRDVGFSRNFGNIEDYNIISCTGGWAKQWDKDFGNPKPSLKIYLNGSSGTSTAVLYDSAEGYNAMDYNYLSLDYYAINQDMALQFNIKLNMYKANQDPSEAVTYTIHFNGPGSQSNVIKDIQPYYDGPFRRCVVDLKEAFKKYANSSEFNISKIWLEGVVGSSEMVNCRAIWLDNVVSYKETSHAPTTLIQEVKKPFDICQDLCSDTNMILYIDPGKERCDDIAVMIPEEYAISSEVISDKVNLLSLNNWNYNPKSNGYYNGATIIFKYPNQKTGMASYYDQTSIDHYGRWEPVPEDASSITDQISANRVVKNNVIAAMGNPISFSVDILGSTTVKPHEYILATSIKDRIQGLHQIKSLMMEFNKDSNPKFKTQLDLNRPSNRFKSKIVALQKEMNRVRGRQLNSQYAEYGLTGLANSSPGAYN